MEKKPALMLAVLDGLKKKGKMKDRPSMDEDESEDIGSDYRAHLEQISKELIDAVHGEDHMAVADLLEEAFECLESNEHSEVEPDSERY